MANKVLFNNLGKQWDEIKDKAMPRLDQLFAKSSFINGPDVSLFESNFAGYIGTSHACGVSNGTDAIKLSIQALFESGYIEKDSKIGVVIPANTFIATILGAEMAAPNAEFVLVDCDEDYLIDTEKLLDTLVQRRDDWDHCIVMPVHLYGNLCEIEVITELCDQFDCWLIEDSSQSHGTTNSLGYKAGSFGHLSAFSMYPGKNLGAAGDAGVITTDDSRLYECIQKLKNWGAREKYYYDFKGYNNRLDSIQAIIVDEKLKMLDVWNLKRNLAAKYYNENISDDFVKPKRSKECGLHTYHIYPILVEDEKRDELITHLNNNGVQCGIHYPVPIENTVAYSHLGAKSHNTQEFSKRLVSLPMHPFLKEEELDIVCETINSF